MTQLQTVTALLFNGTYLISTFEADCAIGDILNGIFQSETCFCDITHLFLKRLISRKSEVHGQVRLSETLKMNLFELHRRVPKSLRETPLYDNAKRDFLCDFVLTYVQLVALLYGVDVLVSTLDSWFRVVVGQRVHRRL